LCPSAFAPQLKRDSLGGNSMSDSDQYDDPELRAAWLSAQRQHVTEYLKEQRVPYGSVPTEPGWDVAPYVAVWPILGASGAPQYWVIVGDLPADFVSADTTHSVRDAVRAFARRWETVAQYMLRGESHPTISIGKPSDASDLGDLLLTRARTLAEFADQDNLW